MTSSLVAYILLVSFFLLDVFVRKGKTAKSLKKTDSDHKSTFFIVLTFIVVLICSLILNWLKFGTFHNETIGTIGISLMVVGLLIRVNSILTLGKYYTRTLLTVGKQDIIKKGLYKYIRHPGYLGTIFIWSAAGLAIQNGIIFITATILILISYNYRITNEEKMLLNTFGEKYSEYKKHSWRLIPFVW